MRYSPSVKSSSDVTFVYSLELEFGTQVNVYLADKMVTLPCAVKAK